jgi:phosphosulfolactate phosphohydrolase-like enzyme
MSIRGKRQVHIDALAESVFRHPDHAIVCIDVLLASTTVVTAVAQGRRTLLAATPDEARRRARSLTNALVVGDPGTPPSEGVDPMSGPAAIEGRRDVARPLVLVSPSAQLAYNAHQAPAVYVACLRNMSATAELLAQRHDRVALVGAGHGTEVRSEDQIVAAWIARMLIERGYEPDGLQTAREIDRWGRADLSVVALGRGAEHLRRLGRKEDLDFVLSRIDDLDVTCSFQGGEMRETWLAPVRSTAAH